VDFTFVSAALLIILLRNSKLSISEMAVAAGFQSLSQFNRVFKRFSGKSPTQYRAATVDALVA
jgi:AraC-like DNA-binding protein